MHNRIIITAFCIFAAIASNSNAFSFKDFFGGSNTNEKVANEPATNNAGIESIAKAVGGELGNPLIALAAQTLGIPSEYIPQIEMLYKLYVNKGKIASSDVASTQGLNNWVKSSADFDYSSLATGLNNIFKSQI